MSAPVDVLAVLQNEIDHAGCLGPRASDARAKRLGSVRAAVAELIEAVEELVLAELEVAGYEAMTPYRSRNYRTACYVRQREAIARRRAALSRIRGAV